jgi:hypothetical protein
MCGDRERRRAATARPRGRDVTHDRAVATCGHRERRLEDAAAECSAPSSRRSAAPGWGERKLARQPAVPRRR